ncbi:MAG: SCP2 sterol-binding domain-containing protein [Archaeoglobaceae archaeon]|nr:SCP2 sterol-binding domain-containing protein [Archaeoglobaceae archaeon]MDW8127817.1 SCP2 sterol-binding domain-containing protein [Archaeoglobaceae archaeon]
MVVVSYPEEGFANMLGQLIEQKVKEEKKAEIAKKMNGKLFLEIREIGVGAMVEFSGESIRVSNERPEKVTALISVADYNTLTMLLTSGILKQLKFIISGKLKIKNLSFVRKFGAILS